MKYARKTVLVDVNSTNHGAVSSNDSITSAIKTLANASEFNRSYFGQNTISISQLNNDLQQLLDRTDLEPDTKLKLYNQSLARYLFLQRESTKSAQTPGNVIIQQPVSAPQSADLSSVSSGRSSPTISEAGSTGTIVSAKSTAGHSRDTPRNGHIKDVLRSTRIPKFKNNLPRSTPKAEILRQNRAEKRMSDFFYGWEGSQ